VGSPASAAVLACLRETPLWTEDGRGLVPALGNTTSEGDWSPVLDGVEFTESPEASAKAGRLNKVSSVMIGTTHDEGRFLMPLLMPMPNGPLSTRDDFTTWLGEYYPEASTKILELYGSELASLGAWKTAALVYTESQYLCPTQRSALWMSKVGTPAFVYRLDYKPSIFDIAASFVFEEMWCSDYSHCSNITAQDVGVGHSADVYLLFDDPRLNFTDHQVAHTIIDYWQNFALSGSPAGLRADGTVLPHWPMYEPLNATMLLSPQPVATDGLRQHQCNFWLSAHSGLPPSQSKTATTQKSPHM